MRRFRFVIWLTAVLAAIVVPGVSKAQFINITIAPPALPVYVQPEIPAPGYIWTPGYWAYGPLGYYWVPGTWVLPPAAGLLWTPGYWGWRDGVYVWNGGYWGPRIGFYGGVNYGFGYGGVGYEGGYWNNGVFSYNRAVNNFGSTNITNVYNKTVVNNTNVTNVSFNGGSGGTTARPTPQEQAAAREQHVAATEAQVQHHQMASTNKALLASENHGRPPIAATSQPGEFTGKGAVAAKEPGTTPPRAPVPPAGNLSPTPMAPRKATSAGKENAPINGGTPPKPLNAPPAPHPVATVPPPKAATPNPPHPSATPPAPHPVAAVPPPKAATPNLPHPSAIPPAPHPVAAAPRPTTHPVAAASRPAPHPAAAARHPEEKPAPPAR